MGRFSGYRLTEMAVPIVVWAVHFVTVYSMAGLACEQDWQRTRVGGAEMVVWLIGGFTLLSWGALAVTARIAWRGWRAQQDQETAGAARGRRRFVSWLALALSAAAAVAVAFTVIPLFLLPTCAG